MSLPLSELTRHLDTLLRVAEIPDELNAINGLQLEASTEISTLACAVDASEAAIDEATRRGAQLLLVHHGLFWAGNRPVVGPHARKLKKCFAAGLSIYSAHAPLDVHPELGNNAGIVRALGLAPDGGFGRYQGMDIGLAASCDLSFAELLERLRGSVGEVRAFGAGPERIRRLAVVSGGAGGYAAKAARAGFDAFLTGEAAHYTAIDAEELGIHLLLAGHYRTETFGVKALGERLASELGLTTFFIEHDTGL
ncbi:MAG TPA: Nif3-like dinuclear metal center hexameric protein [Myxococcales bacterium]|nr:Nif3-like dinuclear metal center hexameric protein [Myxococcales bacterium]